MCPRHSAVQVKVSWYQNESEAPHALTISLVVCSICPLRNWPKQQRRSIEKLHSLLGVSKHPATIDRFSCEALGFTGLCFASSSLISPLPPPLPSDVCSGSCSPLGSPAVWSTLCNSRRPRGALIVSSEFAGSPEGCSASDVIRA